MRSKLLAAALAAAVMAPVMAPAPVLAQRDDRTWEQRKADREWQQRRDDRRADRGDRRDARDDYRWGGDRRDWDPENSYRQGNYRERRLSRNDSIYRGRDNRYYCKRNDGTTGLVIGALGGGVLGNVLGGGTLGTLLGAGGGGLLGREVDRGKVRCR